MTDNNQNISSAQAYGLLSFTVFLWAVGIVIARAVHDDIPLIGLSFWRWLVAAIFLFPFVWRDLKAGSDIIQANRSILVQQGVLMIGSGSLLYYALNFTTAINATLVNATQPALTVLLAWILLGDRLNRVQVLGVFSAIIGVVIMVTRMDMQVLVVLDFNLGDFLVILAILGYAYYAINIPRLPRELGTFPTLFVILITGSLFLLPFYIAETVYIQSVPFSLKTISLVIILSLFVSIMSISMWNIANAVVGPGRAAVFVNLIPVYGAALAMFILGESLYLYHVAGAVLVCVGILLVIKNK